MMVLNNYTAGCAQWNGGGWCRESWRVLSNVTSWVLASGSVVWVAVMWITPLRPERHPGCALPNFTAASAPCGLAWLSAWVSVTAWALVRCLLAECCLYVHTQTGLVCKWKEPMLLLKGLQVFSQSFRLSSLPNLLQTLATA